jgi:hypothetical protein
MRDRNTLIRDMPTHSKCYAHWNFDICVEFDGDSHDRRKSWSFGLTPDEEDADYKPGRGFVGYIQRDGDVEGLH